MFSTQTRSRRPARTLPPETRDDACPAGRRSAGRARPLLRRHSSRRAPWWQRAYYSPTGDYIQLPPPAAFANADLYGATRAHESAHWSGAESRLNREFGKRFGDEKYAAEELVAELSSAILGAELGLPVDHLDDHASYIAHWLRILKADPRALLTIAAKADEAASYLLNLAGRGPGPEPVDDAETGVNDDRASEPALLEAA